MWRKERRRGDRGTFCDGTIGVPMSLMHGKAQRGVFHTLLRGACFAEVSSPHLTHAAESTSASPAPSLSSETQKEQATSKPPGTIGAESGLNCHSPLYKPWEIQYINIVDSASATTG